MGACDSTIILLPDWVNDDGVPGTFLNTDATALAVVIVINQLAITLDSDGGIGAEYEAVSAVIAVPAMEAAFRFPDRISGTDAPPDFVKVVGFISDLPPFATPGNGIKVRRIKFVPFQIGRCYR